MLVAIFFLLLGLILDLIFGWFTIAVNAIPVIVDINIVVINWVGTFKAFCLTVPYLTDLFNLFLVLLLFEAGFWVAKLLLGARDPIHSE
jgi:hypothetical protein